MVIANLMHAKCMPKLVTTIIYFTLFVRYGLLHDKYEHNIVIYLFIFIFILILNKHMTNACVKASKKHTTTMHQIQI